MNEEWDRSKQTYFILRRGNPWQACTIHGKYVCDFPAYFIQEKITRRICFAENDEIVKEIVKEIKE